jgi:hypothetical protein
MISDFLTSRRFGHAATVVMEIGGAGDVVMANTDGSRETVARPNLGWIKTGAEHKAGRPAGR